LGGLVNVVEQRGHLGGLYSFRSGQFDIIDHIFAFCFRGLDWPTAPVIANLVSDHREVVSDRSELVSEQGEVLINAGLTEGVCGIIFPLYRTGKTAIGNGL
jgi:hypothetical protein